MQQRYGPVGDFESTPSMARAARDIARRLHASHRRVTGDAVAEELRSMGYTTSRQSVDRYLRRAHPELFRLPPYHKR